MNLLESIKNTTPRLFIYISSEEVYGSGPIPFKETQMPLPPSPYAISKLAGEHMSMWYGQEYHFPVVVIRLGTFYGPGQPLHKYFAQTIIHALKNELISCNSGQKRRDYIYVEDVVDLISSILLKQNHEGVQIINGAGGKMYRLLEVIELIKTITNSRSQVQFGVIPDRITERNEWLADITKAKEMYGWEPKTTLEDGLKKTITYFK